MVQRSSFKEDARKLRDKAFAVALETTRTPEEAAVRLGVSLSTVMRFKKKLQGKGKR